MSYRAKINELVQKLQLEMPIEVTLEDPINGSEFTVKRENLLSLLMFNPEALVIEAQTVASFYAEMARLQRAAEYKRDRLSTRFTKWKAATAAQARHTKDEVTGKYPSEERTKEAYRAHPDYAKYDKTIAQYTAMAGLFEDLKWAFRMKSAHIESVQRSVGGFEATERSSSSSSKEPSSASPEDADRLEELAGSIFRASANELDDEMKAYWPQNETTGEETDDEEEEETDDELEDSETEVDDEADPDDPPPPPEPKQAGPKKKSRKKKRGAKKKARARSTR